MSALARAMLFAQSQAHERHFKNQHALVGRERLRSGN